MRRETKAVGAPFLKRRAPARTAELVAFYRALEALEPTRPPLFRDPHAALFLPEHLELWRRAAAIPAVHRSLTFLVDLWAPGARLALVARTRFIDDVVRRRARDGVANLVLLGAGFDCRAHRLSEARALTVFEVDLPEVLAEKRRTLAGAGDAIRSDVRYVEVDLVRCDLDTALADAGFEATAPTLVVAEGVASYLPETTVLRFLAWAGRLAPTSSVVFSYVHRGFFDGSLPGLARMRRKARHSPEQWISGFFPEDLGAVLGDLGLVLAEDLGSDEYRARYLRTPHGARRYSLYRVAEADVRR